jgi:Methyltransferase domain
MIKLLKRLIPLKARNFIKLVVPYGLVEWRIRRVKNIELQWREAYHEERRSRIIAIEQSPAGTICGNDYEQVISFLKNHGVPDAHLQGGSVPKASLEFLYEHVFKLIDSTPPLGLHIGNFVGVSLAFFSASLRDRHPDAITVSLDPNVPHRGIANPQAHVSALLTACGLQQNTMIIAGYSNRKSISNDGAIFDGYDPQKEFITEAACEDSLRNLALICPKTFDVVMIDGNHEASYLISEIRDILPLLKPGAFVILDDVDEAWIEIRDVFTNIASLGLTPLTTDGRVGIARLAFG